MSVRIHRDKVQGLLEFAHQHRDMPVTRIVGTQERSEDPYFIPVEWPSLVYLAV